MLNENLRRLRDEKGVNQKDVAEFLKISRQAYSYYELGKRDPSNETLRMLSEYFNVSIDYLLGQAPKYVIPIKTKVVPLVGEIVAGKPKYADEEFQYFIEIDDVIRADFCLKVKGDSMINARIYEGDIVFIRKQSDVEDGEIAAVRIDDEATLKRVYKMPGRVQLRAENPSYEPINITEEDHKDVEILGKAIAFQSRVR